MLTPLSDLFHNAQEFNYAVGAFNIYNLEGIKAVVRAAESENSPAILQIHPAALNFHGSSLLAAAMRAVENSRVPMLVHLDHATKGEDIQSALSYGITSIMADGSQMSLKQNIDFTSEMASLAHRHGAAIEAELGRLSGTEDGLSVSEYEALLTEPHLAVDFVQQTGVDTLAVCIGNVHGHYRGEPILDFKRLEEIHKLVSVPLILHGASGLSDALIHRTIECGVRKFNVNTEVREAYLVALRANMQKDRKVDLIDIMTDVIDAMQAVVVSKLRQFQSSGRA
jgi:tagatose 1,6-diphosphate aldolase GatY/KbaY